jgi:hypothetical protein
MMTLAQLAWSQNQHDYRYPIFHRKSKRQTPSKGSALIKKRYHNNFKALISTDLYQRAAISGRCRAVGAICNFELVIVLQVNSSIQTFLDHIMSDEACLKAKGNWTVDLVLNMFSREFSGRAYQETLVNIRNWRNLLTNIHKCR